MKNIDNFSKIPAFLGSECWLRWIRLSLHYEKRYSVYMPTFIYQLTSAIIAFSKAHGMLCISHGMQTHRFCIRNFRQE